MKLLKYFKQLICKHDWQQKGFGTITHDYGNMRERRCFKCKKIEQY